MSGLFRGDINSCLFQFRTWREGLLNFGELGYALGKGQVIYLNDVEASNVHAYLRDLASTTQALTRLYSFFINGKLSII